MYRDYKVRLKYSKNENNNTNISKRKDIVFR